MWNDAESQIEPELGSQERLLWSGHPRQGIVLRSSDVFLIPFSLMWGGFAIFWEVTVLLGGAPFFFMLWGIPFVLVGLHLIFGRFIVDARQRAKTYYGVTSERIVIITGLFRRSIKSLDVDTLTDISLTERGDLSGTITLGPNRMPLGWGAFSGSNWPGMSQYSAPALELIDDARSVYEIIREAQREARNSR